ncbi:MAG: hypothetical protein HWD92_06375 [Flavobacteriia bacterium]|nr:hypothetical protein [Flavobacteriia bacterium]
MKKIIALSALTVGGLSLNAQVTTDPPENINPEDSLTIYVDISALDMGLDHNQLLMDAVDAGEDMYIWTWSPVEHPVGHPLRNGLGSQEWKNSNDTLIMTHEGGYVFSFSMIPVDFYETSAAEVYAKDIEFLVKPKDGGGYGDPDIKSNDLLVAVDPPTTTKDPVYQFPEFVSDSTLVTIVYDNNREPKTTMQDLPEGNVFVHLEYWRDGDDLSLPGQQYALWTQVDNTPELGLWEVEPGVFHFSFVPGEFLNAGGTTDEIVFIKAIVKRGDINTVAGRNDQVLEVDLEECP